MPVTRYSDKQTFLYMPHSLFFLIAPSFYSCPLDYVKVYDGLDNSSAVIGTYCGQQRNLVLYSSESSLYVLFSTLQRTANTQNRGFKGIFEFSESFVKLGKFDAVNAQIERVRILTF